MSEDRKIVRGASVSVCGRYRFRLLRYWDPMRPRVGWVMLNPSTADSKVDDPTIRRCMAFACAWGFGGIEVANLWPVRGADPVEAFKDFSLPHAPAVANKMAIAEVMKLPLVVAAWGSSFKHWRPLTYGAGLRDLYCLGTNADGAPKHPLYLRGDVELRPW